MDSRQNPEPDKQNTSRNSKIYFIIAALLIFVVALVWSIDTSLVYLFSGACVFFIFLGLWNHPRNNAKRHFSQPTISPVANQDAPPNPSLFRTLLKHFLKKKYSSGTQSGESTINPSVKKIGKVRLIFWLVMGAIFFIGMLSIFPDADEVTAEDYFQNAEQYYLSGMYDSAASNYKRVIRTDPTRSDAMMGFGNTLFSQNKFDSAILLYDKALATDPNLNEARYKKGLVYYNQKNYTQAVQALKALVEKAPDYSGVNQLLGDVYYDQTLYDEAFLWYERAYANNPHNHWICYVLGYLYQTKGDAPRAISLYKEALSFDSTEMDIYKRLGDLLPGDEGNYYRSRASGEKQW